MDRENVALEELKLLQAIIARQDQMRFRIKTWATTIFSALSLALFTEKIELSTSSFLLAALLVSGLFWALDAIYRTSEERAIRRAKVVEECIESAGPYKGPKIAASLSTTGSWREFMGALQRARVFALYVILILLAVAISVIEAFQS
ncbi:MAG: hypothetical protein JSU63_20995 [Phycisphaerales bacterium]|nr:MAG: hypothetical protein JSU63_20995 [Phycisphaerales bacterium]